MHSKKSSFSAIFISIMTKQNFKLGSEPARKCENVFYFMNVTPQRREGKKKKNLS